MCYYVNKYVWYIFRDSFHYIIFFYTSHYEISKVYYCYANIFICIMSVVIFAFFVGVNKKKKYFQNFIEMLCNL